MGTRRRGLLRYRADWIPILWIQATLLLSLLPWMLAMPLWTRALLAVPLVSLRSSCAYIQHNQGHLSVFWSRALNFVYDIQLALMTGYITPLWELQHARGHHRHYLTPAKDPASIIDRKTGEPMARWAYCLIGNLTIIRDSWRIAREEVEADRADRRPNMAAQFIIACTLAALLCYLDPFDFLCFILVPNVIVSWFVWFTSYEHHLGVPGETHFDGSINHFERGFNLTTFNVGHHTAHHEKPTLHWTLLPKRSAQILQRLDPSTVRGELDRELLQQR